jgi:hypothetical protein
VTSKFINESDGVYIYSRSNSNSAFALANGRVFKVDTPGDKNMVIIKSGKYFFNYIGLLNIIH